MDGVPLVREYMNGGIVIFCGLLFDIGMYLKVDRPTKILRNDSRKTFLFFFKLLLVFAASMFPRPDCGLKAYEGESRICRDLGVTSRQLFNINSAFFTYIWWFAFNVLFLAKKEPLFQEISLVPAPLEEGLLILRKKALTWKLIRLLLTSAIGAIVLNDPKGLISWLYVIPGVIDVLIAKQSHCQSASLPFDIFIVSRFAAMGLQPPLLCFAVLECVAHSSMVTDHQFLDMYNFGCNLEDVQNYLDKHLAGPERYVKGKTLRMSILFHEDGKREDASKNVDAYFVSKSDRKMYKVRHPSVHPKHFVEKGAMNQKFLEPPYAFDVNKKPEKPRNLFQLKQSIVGPNVVQKFKDSKFKNENLEPQDVWLTAF